ncbi:30S ribosomal protein S20 [Virgibacillus phasianinus]|uniref:Small ribosomal subunit protein bS20 n=1 Tax=Virgibacillus phasianinus TaxID=2017483 RepID=A0A220U4T7_9BACI|nr:30S ribosomal protein S20 [Virgibacillus phasianinus]ASK63137.1 30S ribosomal protein S20 [Virgibacillus phasianinus]
MANIKSAIKRVGVNQKKHDANQSYKSDMRSQVKRVEKLVEAKDLDNAKTALQQANKKIDKAVQKGIVHQNNGNRQKSRLSKMVNGLSA